MKKALALLLMLVCIINTSIYSVFASSCVLKSEKGTYEYDFIEGETFEIDFELNGFENLNSASFRVLYDPKVIQAVETKGYPVKDFIHFTDENDNKIPFISNSMVNGQLKLVPSSTNSDYDSKSDGVKTASEIGIIRLAAFVTATENNNLKGLYDGGKFFRMTFKMIAPGSTTINIASDKKFTTPPASGSESIDIEVIPAKVTINSSGSGSNNNTTTTEATTETTTKKNTTETTTKKSSSEVTTKKTTTTEATTETTTAKTVEATTEATTQSVVKLKTFNDIANYPWAVNAIEQLATKEIINGVGNGMFNPAANVKRADFLLMLMKALGLEGEAKSNFADVDSSRYYANAVGLAKDLGIATGSGDNLFKPDDNISRQDMMVLANRALATKVKLQDAQASVLDKFKDKTDISNYAVESLAKMVNAGIVNGTGNKIEPKSNTTRAQAAVIIYNIYNI